MIHTWCSVGLGAGEPALVDAVVIPHEAASLKELKVAIAGRRGVRVSDEAVTSNVVASVATGGGAVGQSQRTQEVDIAVDAFAEVELSSLLRVHATNCSAQCSTVR